jgi:RsiW-degrading membrane proteinase PrsW (M82 family)
MTVHVLVPALVGLLPVLSFLGALVYLDSYKLVRLRLVVSIIACGAAMAGASYALNAQMLALVEIDFGIFSRYVAPISEELLKGLLIVALIGTHRIGFLVDAAILGFAIGTGFAMVENLYYLHLLPDARIGTWIVRGFGTAIMHGGASAIFAVMGLAMLDRARGADWKAYLPGLAVAAVLHSAFNHFFLSPMVSTLGIILVLQPLLYTVFARSGSARASMRIRKCSSSSTRGGFPTRRSASTCTHSRASSRAWWLRTCCVTCACTLSLRCAPRAS